MLEGELEKVVPASMAELQHIAGVKRTTDGKGGSTEKKGVLAKISPLKIRQRSGSTQRKIE